MITPYYRKFRLARNWSNQELRKIAPLFAGSVVNVSGWKDEDKQGNYYKNYFVNKSSYAITNFAGKRGWQGDLANEIKLDLTKPLPGNLRRKFDVVFNHTTLEHIFAVKTAFKNLCQMSRDIVIIIVPFLQEMHFDKEAYRDYWRFTPFAVRGLFEENKLKMIYISANNGKNQSIYLFAVASRKPELWKNKVPLADKSIFDILGEKSINWLTL